MLARSLGGAGAARRETLFLYTTKTPSFGRDIKISVFGIFKHFRTWNLTHTVAMESTVFIRYDDTLKVNGHDERFGREVCETKITQSFFHESEGSKAPTTEVSR